MIWINKLALTAPLAIGLGIVLGIASNTMVQAQDAAIGDSIALGTGNALHVPTYAWIGASSCEILSKMPSGPFGHVVISAGINSPSSPCLAEIIEKVQAKQITMIVPANINLSHQQVIDLANLHRFHMVEYSCKGGCSKSNFHPGSYSVVARDVQTTWK
jgi:hypothetical protein